MKARAVRWVILALLVGTILTGIGVYFSWPRIRTAYGFHLIESGRWRHGRDALHIVSSHYPRNKPYVLRRLEDDNVNIRMLALEVIEECEHGAVLRETMLGLFISARRPDLRRMAAYVMLVNLLDPYGIEMWIRVLEDPREDDDVERAAIVLSRCVRSASPSPLDGLTPENARVRTPALRVWWDKNQHAAVADKKQEMIIVGVVPPIGTVPVVPAQDKVDGSEARFRNRFRGRTTTTSSGAGG